VPAPRNVNSGVTIIGLITILWGSAQVALGLSCNLPGDGWKDASNLIATSLHTKASLAFVLQGILGILAGSGSLLRLQWGRIMTFILVAVGILWAVDSTYAYLHQEFYRWKALLIPFAAIQVVYAILALVILSKNGVAFAQPCETDQGGERRRIFKVSAWASPSAGVMIASVFWLWTEYHHGVIGERPPAVLLFYVVLLFVSAAAGLAAVISFFGIRSWRDALSIIPGALLGICINGCVVLMCMIDYVVEGKNLAGCGRQRRVVEARHQWASQLRTAARKSSNGVLSPRTISLRSDETDAREPGRARTWTRLTLKLAHV
jgi:hypothetical protein